MIFSLSPSGSPLRAPECKLAAGGKGGGSRGDVSASTLVQSLPTPTPNPSPIEVGCFRFRSLTYWSNSGTPEFDWGGEHKRARIAAKKPKAAVMAPSSGTTSCRPPPASPPWGRWESIAAKPKGRAVGKSSIPGNRRRSSATTAARFRATERTSGSAKALLMFIVCSKVAHTRTKQEQCQGCLGRK